VNLVCELEKCTGCGMCSNVCPKNAIEMSEGERGFVYPKIDKNLCIECNLCRNKCPSNVFQATETNVKKVYVSWNKDKKIRKNSSSGGIFTEIAKKIIEQGGVVCGVAWNEEFHPHHILVNRTKDISKLQGSKYSQSITGDIYKLIKEKLDKGILILFSGTPCQNAALKSFLGKNYQNLYSIDLVCHGVPSNKMLDNYLFLFEKDIQNVRLRHKDPFWDYSFVRIDFKDGTKYQKLTIEDDYFNLFNVGFTLRNSCHNCQYANTNRKGDIR